MEVKIRRYVQSTRKLPSTSSGALYAEYNISNAVVEDDIIQHDEVELGDFFENTVASTDLRLVDALLDPNVLTNLNDPNALLGITITRSGNTISGYIDGESIIKDERTGEYSLTVVNWWKYMYEVVGGEPMTAITNFVGMQEISSWLYSTFACSQVTSVNYSVNVSNLGLMPYIDVVNYHAQAPLMKIRDMIDNIYKVHAGIFLLKGTVLHFVQYHKTVGSPTNIDSLVIDDTYTSTPIIKSAYDTVLVSEAGVTYYRRLEGGKVVTRYLGLQDEQLKPSWSVLDLRQKVWERDSYLNENREVNFVDISVINSTTFEVKTSTRANDKDYIDTPPNNSWIGKILSIFKLDAFYNGYQDIGGLVYANRQASTRWRCRILDVNGNNLTVSWMGREKEGGLGNKTERPLSGKEYVCEIFTPTERRIFDLDKFTSQRTNLEFEYIRQTNDLIKTFPINPHRIESGIYFVPSLPITEPYLNGEVLYRIFNPTKRVELSVRSIAIGVWEQVLLNGVTYKVISAKKNLTQEISELIIEKII